MVYVLTVALVFVLFITIYICSRLLVYIQKLESKIEQQIEKNDNMYQSLKELVANDYLLTDGRLKKLIIQKEDRRIFNGVKIDEQQIEI